jgi:macrodomain Ter protein organizer (MatP/YcbG family)
LEIPITIYNSQTKHELTYEQYILILEKILPDLINNIPKDQLNEVYSNLTEFLKEENHKIETNKIIENKEEIIKYCESTLLQEGIEFLNKYPNIDYLRSVYLQIGVSKQLINKIVKIIRTKYPKNYNNEIKNAISQKELERHIIINRISLKNYLDNLIQTGHSRREIKQLLIEVGWDDNFVASIN